MSDAGERAVATSLYPASRMALQNDPPRPPGEHPVTMVTLEIYCLTGLPTYRARRSLGQEFQLKQPCFLYSLLFEMPKDLGAEEPLLSQIHTS